MPCLPVTVQVSQVPQALTPQEARRFRQGCVSLFDDADDKGAEVDAQELGAFKRQLREAVRVNREKRYSSACRTTVGQSAAAAVGLKAPYWRPLPSERLLSGKDVAALCPNSGGLSTTVSRNKQAVGALKYVV